MKSLHGVSATSADEPATFGCIEQGAEQRTSRQESAQRDTETLSGNCEITEIAIQTLYLYLGQHCTHLERKKREQERERKEKHHCIARWVEQQVKKLVSSDNSLHICYRLSVIVDTHHNIASRTSTQVHTC